MTTRSKPGPLDFLLAKASPPPVSSGERFEQIVDGSMTVGKSPG